MTQSSKWFASLVTALSLMVLNAQSAGDPWQDADALRTAGKFKESADAFSQLIRENPNSPRGYKGRGLALWKIGNFSAAVLDFDKAISIDPKNAALYNERGLALHGEKRWDKALRDYDRAIELEPANGLYFFNRALTWDAMGEPDKAVRDFTKTIESNPTDAFAYKYRSDALSRQGFYEQAIADCDKAIELNPKDAAAYHYRALAYDVKGDDDKVLADFDKSLELNPKNAPAHNSRGFFLANHGDQDKAIASYTKAVELEPRTARYYNNRGYAWLSNGKMDLAMEDFNKALELDPKSTKAFRNRAGAWFAQGKYEEAIADATRSIELNPEEAKSFRIRSEARAATGDGKGAREDLRQAVILGPQPPFGMLAPVTPEILARDKAALKAWLSNDSPETRAPLAGARHDRAFAILNDPKIAVNKEALEEAAAYAKSATELEPEDPGHWFLMGLVFRELGKREVRARVMAEHTLRHSVDLDPEYAPAWLELSLMMMEQERGWEAMTSFEQAIENDPLMNARVAVGPLTAMYALNDEGPRGLDFFQEVYAANPEVSALGIGVAIMLDHMGDRKAALAQAHNIMLVEEPGTPEYDYAAKLVAEWEGTKP